jgi:hypothetical protein
MHHFTIATLLEIFQEDADVVGGLLQSAVGENLYVASGFAEGRTGASIQTSALRMEQGPGGILLNVSKKPCSLSWSMDLFTVSTPAPEGMDAALAVAIIPADTPGLERRPFLAKSHPGGCGERRTGYRIGEGNGVHPLPSDSLLAGRVAPLVVAPAGAAFGWQRN